MKPTQAASVLALATLVVLACGALLSASSPAFDASGLASAHAWSAGWLDRAFRIVTWLGSLYVLLPAALLLAWHAGGARMPRAAVFLPAALIGAAILARLAKLAIARPRPELFPPLIAMPDDASFPSAHAMQVTAFALAWVLRPGTRPTVIPVLAACLLIAAVAISRIYLQVHFPSDVAFGIAAALLWVLALRALPVWQRDVA